MVKMYHILVLFCAVVPWPGSHGIAQTVENRPQSGMPAIKPHTELIHQTTLLFPENTQLSVALVDGEKVQFYGVKRLVDSLTAIENHQNVFETGSISKVFTSTLLSSVDASHQLALDDAIQDYLELDWNTDETITFLQLANHTSGLPRLPSNLNLFQADPGNPYKNYDEAKLLAYLTGEVNLNATPGVQFEYSNLGAGLLGYLLGEILHSNYEALLHEKIFSKYGMSNSTTEKSNLKNELIPGLDGKGSAVSNWEFNALVGAGGILSTAEDLSKFVAAHFDPRNAELRATTQPTFSVNENMEIGLGWHIISLNDGKEAIWHNGATGGYTSSVALDLNKKVGVVVLSNVSGFNQNMREIDNLCFRLIQLLREEK